MAASKEPFLDLAHNVWAMPEEKWIDDSPRQEDIDSLKKEATSQSSIDEVNLRAEMITMWQDGSVNLRVRELPERTRVVFLGTDEQWEHIPWPLWARIFQAMGYPVGRVLFYAHPSKRFFPVADEAIAAKHINAGYSFLCQQSIVVIYRFEEATRVLLHELLHTACFDSEMETEDCEANTEAWTELFLCAILSRGRKARFNSLWSKQSNWIKAQTEHLAVNWNIRTREDYVWRYTIGRHIVLDKMGYIDDKPVKDVDDLSLRFTTPEWDLAPSA
jgi:hypothetical protein